MRSRLLLASVLAVAVLVGGWWAVARKSPIRPAPSPAQIALAKPLVQASNALGFKVAEALFQADPKRQNLLISPLGLSQCMALLLEGSRGPERDEIKKAVGLGNVADAELGNLSHTLVDAVLSDPERPLWLANAVFIARPGAVRSEFAEQIENRYAGRVFLSGDPAKATKEINDWSSNSTGGKIPTILDQVDPMMVVAFLDAMAFAARWEIEFEEPHTKFVGFTTLSGKEVTTPVMFGRSFRAKCLKEEGLEGVLLDYKGGQFSMAAFLPPQGESALTLLPKLRKEGLERVLKRFAPNKFSIGLPRFSLQNTLGLNRVMNSLGVRAAYGHLDCSPIAPDLASGHFLSDVRQVAKIEVDEVGTRAEQATAAVVTKGSDPYRFFFRQAFLYLILHNPSGAVVFLGICGDPSAPRA